MDEKPTLKKQPVKKTVSTNTNFKPTTVSKKKTSSKKNNIKVKKSKKGTVTGSIFGFIFLVCLIAVWYFFPFTVKYYYLDEANIEYEQEPVLLEEQKVNWFTSLQLPDIADYFDDYADYELKFYDKDNNEYNNQISLIDFRKNLELFGVLNKIDEVPTISDVPVDDNLIYSGNYYDSIDLNNLTQLRTLLNSTIQRTSYNAAGSGGILIESDVAINNGVAQDYLYGIYDSREIEKDWKNGKNFEREHVWCNARLGMSRVTSSGKNQASDLHNLRAIGGVYSGGINQSRSDRYFTNDNLNPELGHTVGKEAFFPGKNHKGDVARILMYMVVAYDFLKLSDDTDALANYVAYDSAYSFIGDASFLLQWHESDPVDAFEFHRNEVIFSYQHNRNPFIDHPEIFNSYFNNHSQLWR
jgi:endonuclease I